MKLASAAAIPVGGGALLATGFVTGDLLGGEAGGALTYQHHVTQELAAFAQGTLGYGWGNRTGLAYGAIAGLSWRW